MSDVYQDEKRDMGTAIKRELLCRCPRCGEGKLFRAFLKPVDNCAVCGEDYTHHRADDLPAYLSIVIVGHVAVGGFIATDQLVVCSAYLTDRYSERKEEADKAEIRVNLKSAV